ncbi:hypothetical protein [Kitasatospora purpeofusca]|uniref:hypothetical protein n=1 Tax=Kitasatospora purpeofusca TaxID=67352 RepID=UPI0035D5CC6C
MSDIFHCIQRQIRTSFGTGPICVHVENIRDCTIKQHPDYSKFRESAIAAGNRSHPESRSPLWESMVAMGRIYDSGGHDTWRMIILDCLSPVLRSRSWRISRELDADRADIQSDMVEVALEVWHATRSGVPAHRIRGAMIKEAVSRAYKRVGANGRETARDSMDTFASPQNSPRATAFLRPSSVGTSGSQNPHAAEIIRGEQVGAMLQALEQIGLARAHHAEIRSGIKRSTALSHPNLARAGLPGAHHYYRLSDLLPAHIGIRPAAEVLGIAETAALRMVRDGSFPCPVTRMGRSYRVPVKAFMAALGIPDAPFHPDDVENGAERATSVAGGIDIAEVPQGLDCPDF